MLGKTVSHYRILEKLGQGGMGEVYLAEDTRLGRKVALKFLAPELARDHESLVRFRNEARAAAELSHPNIATLHDIGETDGEPFLVLEYLKGQSLRDRIAQGPLSIDDVIHIGKALAAGLTEAHAHGIVHRDIKSANVMLTRKGGVKILDFGLARREDATQITRSGTTPGTVAYMSPEQIRGEAADQRSDIWSMGVVLYECLTGRPPFFGEGGAVTHQILSADVTPPTALRTGVPLELERAVLRCLEKDAALRCQHADDLLAELKVLESSPHPKSGSAAPTASGNFSSVTAPGNTRRVLLIAVVLIAAATWIGLKLWSVGEPAPAQPQGEPSVAVIDFQDAPGDDGLRTGATMTSLVQGGLIEASPCRVLTLEYLKDVRRRTLGTATGPIQPEEAMRIARVAGASMLVTAEVIRIGDELAVSWRLMDTAGTALGAGRSQSPVLFAAADSAVFGIVPALARACGSSASPQGSVADLTTHSEEAYRHYSQGIDALDNGRHTVAKQELLEAVAADSTFALAWFALARTYGGTSSAWSEEGGRPGCEAGERAWRLRSRLGVMERMFLEGWLARDCGRSIASAIATYREIHARWPDSREATYGLAEMLTWIHLNGDAASVAEEGLRLYPQDHKLKITLAGALCRTGRLQESLALSEQLAAAYPEDATNWEILGRINLGLGLPDAAEKAFLQSVDIDPGWSGAREFWIATCAAYRGNVDQALARLRNIPPASPKGWERFYLSRNLAMLLSACGRRRDASAELAVAYSLFGRYFAMSVFDLVYDSPPDSLRELYEKSLGSLLERLEHQSSRQRQFFTRFQIARLDLNLGQFPEAGEQIAIIVPMVDEIFAPNAYWWAFLAEFALAEGRAEDALECLDKAAEQLVFSGEEYDVTLRAMIARAHTMLGQFEESRQVLTSLTRIYPWYFPALYELGQVYENLGRPEDAAKSYLAFLDAWSEADEDLPQLKDARTRLAAIQNGS